MKICLFSSYYEKPFVPNHVKFYLEELNNHFDQIILLTNKREIDTHNQDFLKKIGVELMMVDNEGYDFGMWYKAFNKIDMNGYSEIGLINDSCICFAKLDKFFEWYEHSTADYCGMLSSNELGNHIQSYFIVIKKNAIQHVYDYFMETGIIKGDVREVINRYEIEIYNYLKNKGMELDSYLKCDSYNDRLNPMMLNPMELIRDGMPLIKKKILLNDFRGHEKNYLSQHGYDFNFDYKEKLKSIMYQNNDNININYLLDI